MMTSSLRKNALFFLLVISSQLLCAYTQETTGEFATTGEEDEGTTGEVLSVGTTGGGGSGFAIPTPAPVTGDAQSSTTIVTNWSPNNRKRQAGYTVNEEMSSDNLQFNLIYTGPAETFEHTVDNLQADTTYYFRVFLVGAAGNSDYSTVTAITTLSGSGAGATTGAVVSTNTTAGGVGNSVEQEQTQAGGQKQGGLSGGVIAGIVIAAIAVAAAIAAVVAKTAFASAAPVAGHWLDSAVQNPLYQAGEQAFENPMYEAPAEATA